MAKSVRRTKRAVEEIKEETRKQQNPRRKPPIKPTEHNTVPTGSTLLNLACTDKPYGGFVMGKMVNIIGDSASGKSVLALSVLAEMACDPKFDDYELVYDDAEYACQFDLPHMFGKNIAKRISDDQPSVTIADWYGRVVSLLKKEKPFIYMLDSLDALTTKEEQERAKEFSEGKDVGGSFKTEKPKMMSEALREVVDGISDTKSILIVISQTRDKIGVVFGSKKTRSGGRALKFYLSHEIWISVGKSILRTKKRIGANIIVKVSKNKVTGKVRTITFPLYDSYGIDDIQSCIDFMVDETYWNKKGSIIKAPDFDFEGQKRGLISLIEREGLEGELKEIVGRTWEEVEGKLKLNRKRKYE